jgi:trimethylamine--corrinoid protein Co-methyltransferase
MPLTLMPTLRREQLELIHEQSLNLLARVGSEYNTPEAIRILRDAGCPVDADRNWASIPRHLVEWALEKSPRVLRLGARDPQRDVVLDGRASHHTTDSQGTRAVVFETGEERPSTAEDLRRGLLFADALDKLEIVNVMVAAQDVPTHLRTLAHFSLAFTQTNKHVRTGVLHAGQVPFLVEMAKAATGEDRFRPIFSAVDCTISPLLHDGPMTEACIELAKMDVPIMIYPMPLAGGNSPVAPAGTALLHNAEFLSALVLFQLVNPGSPIIYGVGASQLDMKTGRYGGSANFRSCSLALGEMARFYNLPFNLSGLSTASPKLDAQYGFEASTACLTAYLAGADEIYSMGLLAQDQVLSLDKMVLDNHLTREIESMVGSMPLDAEHLQVDLIERVGIGGHFLDQPETRSYTRAEYLPVWPPGGKDVLQLAHEEAQRILTEHQPPRLPQGAEPVLSEILDEADQALG